MTRCPQGRPCGQQPSPFPSAWGRRALHNRMEAAASTGQPFQKNRNGVQAGAYSLGRRLFCAMLSQRFFPSRPLAFAASPLSLRAPLRLPCPGHSPKHFPHTAAWKICNGNCACPPAGRSGARLRAAGCWPLRFGSSPASWPFGRCGRTSPCRPLCPGRIPQRRIPKSPQCVPCDAAALPCAGSVPRPRSRCTHRPGSNSGCPVSADSKFPKTVGRAVLSAPVHRSVDRLPCNPPMCFSGT